MEDIASADVCPKCGGSTLLEDRYELLEVVGHGAMGTTYRATRLEDGQVVAIKELPVRQVDSLETMDLFSREAAVLRKLDHPGVPDYFEDFTAGQGRATALFLVQEFIDGLTLAEEWERSAEDEDDVLEVMADVLDILTYLHGRDPPVIHRDIKPKNVMRRVDGRLVLIDFGSVRAVLEDPEEGGSTVAGTFGFMAPEQFMGTAVPATDVYGVGAMAVALLSGKDPREMLGPDQRLHWEQHVDVGRPFVDLLEEMLTFDFHERSGDAAALAARTRAIRRGDVVGEAAPAPAPRLSDPEPEPDDDDEELELLTAFEAAEHAPSVTDDPGEIEPTYDIYNDSGGPRLLIYAGVAVAIVIGELVLAPAEAHETGGIVTMVVLSLFAIALVIGWWKTR